jgi:hypothetical protein
VFREDGPRVRFCESDGGVYVENIDNTSRIMVNYAGATKQLKMGERERLGRECESPRAARIVSASPSCPWRTATDR